MSKKNTYEIITERIIAQIETTGELPWTRPWDATGADAPRSIHGRPYSGVNRLILGMEAQIRGYEDNRWITYNQAKKVGAQVRKGEKSVPVILWKRIEKETNEIDPETGKKVKENIFFARYFNVFNVEQVDNLDVSKVERERHEWDEIERCIEVVEGFPTPPTIEHHGTRAYYSPAQDVVVMPEHDRFKSPEQYYGVLFHELAHATGHKDRLNRRDLVSPAPFGSEDYSREELVAELASAYVCGSIGIDTPERETNSVAYLKNWIKVLNDDPKMIVHASARASKAADWILGRDLDTA